MNRLTCPIWELKQLRLPVKSGLQFLNTLCLRLKDKIMFLVWQGLKVAWAVIVFNAIKVMYYPAFRQRFIVCLLPYKPMFPNIPAAISPWMVRFINHYVSTIFLPSSLPHRMVFAPRMVFVHFPLSPSQLQGTAFTPYRYPRTWLTTINTRMLMSLFPLLHIFRMGSMPGFYTSKSLFMMIRIIFPSGFPSLFLISHIVIVSGWYLNVKSY